MIILTPPPFNEYELLDSGNGYRLERFGANIVARPDASCVWKQAQPENQWEQANAYFKKLPDGKSMWQKSMFKEEWFFKIPPFSKTAKHSIVASLRLAPSVKNIGIFPENVAHWPWIAHRLSKRKNANVLNLFGYTGLTTLFMANLGASVCHVDASKPSVEWAKRNQDLSKMNDAAIRWIVDDCTKFVHREVKRGMKYDAIIMDPPAFGRDNKGNVFEFEKRIGDLLELCKKALSPRPLFFVFNGYSMGYSSTVLANLLNDHFPEQQIEHGELHLREVNDERSLPCSIFARF
ncbi:class I SAM-dependent methyltransferase [Candidatus Dependentiae bacterium]|jgi:23S rRNA (cytosine1962-C5)-methyltransferase|nr:class I SAM-dependent methyltransferase [Candidatus Dependentiae bacterium]